MNSFDLRDTLIPFSMLQVVNHFARMNVGDSMEIIGNDMEMYQEVTAILPAENYQVVSRDVETVPDEVFRIVLRKTDMKTIKHKRRNTMSEDLNAVEVSSSVDARGSACPGPLLEAKKGIGKVKVGEVLEILSSDSGTRSDIPAWAKKVGHEYLGVVESDGYDKLFVRRKK